MAWEVREGDAVERLRELADGSVDALEGFRFVGVERDPEYVAIARARIEFWALSAARRRVREGGQLGLV